MQLPACQHGCSDAACPTCRDGRVGLSIGGFRLERKIASNGRSAVYRARGDAGDAAIKIFSGLAMGDPLDRVRREAHIQSRVAHRSVARLIGGGSLADGSPYLISEWVDGRLLADRFAAGPLPIGELMPILAAIGEALAAIHVAGIVHRDLKPSNIVLPAQAPPAAVILDFGHSLALGDVRLTGSGWILGTAPYMAPEQIAGKSLDARADLYSLGVIVYQALTGHLPHDTSSRSEPVIRPRRRAPELAIPAAAEDLCLWLMERDPARRLPNAHVLSVTLRAMITGDTGADRAQTA